MDYVAEVPPPSGSDFSPAPLIDRVDAGGGLRLVKLHPTIKVARTYVSPGQYIEVRLWGETGYFVLAGEPGAKAFDLFMRAGGGVSDLLLAAPLGTLVEVTGAIGAGFPMHDARSRPLVVVLSGTGIAAARPIVRARIAGNDAEQTVLLVGVRKRSELAMAADLDAWERVGVRIVVCLSQPDDPFDDPRCVRGYVQDALRTKSIVPTTGGARIFAVGGSSMIEAVRDLAPELGVAPQDVHTNHDP
jgi:NAD(P)H-flavin reductase